jgi:hypothetical protein
MPGGFLEYELWLAPVLPSSTWNGRKVFAVAGDDGEAGKNGACGNTAVVGANALLLCGPRVIQLLCFIRVRQDLECGKSVDKFRKKAAFSAKGLAL